MKVVVKCLALALLVVIFFNTTAFGIRWVMTDHVHSWAYRHLGFHINGSACGIDLGAIQGRLLLSGLFLIFLVRAVRRGELRSTAH